MNNIVPEDVRTDGLLVGKAAFYANSDKVRRWELLPLELRLQFPEGHPERPVMAWTAVVDALIAAGWRPRAEAV